MKKEYINPKLEVIVVESEKVLAESSYGDMSGTTDHEWYPN